MLPKLYLHLVGYLFSRLTEVVFISELASYAGSNVAAVRATHAAPVMIDVPDKDIYPRLTGWGLDVLLTCSPGKSLVVLVH
jgi:hypothetical protein